MPGAVSQAAGLFSNVGPPGKGHKLMNKINKKNSKVKKNILSRENGPLCDAVLGVSQGLFYVDGARGCVPPFAATGCLGVRQGVGVVAPLGASAPAPGAFLSATLNHDRGFYSGLFLTEKICRSVSGGMPARITGLWVSLAGAPLALGLSIARWLNPLSQRMVS